MIAHPQRMRCERFEAKPKEVIRASNYKDHTRSVAANEHLLDDLEEITDSIEKGRPLDRRFYRSGLKIDDDPLLVMEGIKHLHLGNMGSDTLLFAVEYSDRVVFLEVNTHKHFKSEPKGSILLSLHRQCLKSEDETAVSRQTEVGDAPPGSDRVG
jgi:hypothetical protein